MWDGGGRERKLGGHCRDVRTRTLAMPILASVGTVHVTAIVPLSVDALDAVAVRCANVIRAMNRRRSGVRVGARHGHVHQCAGQHLAQKREEDDPLTVGEETHGISLSRMLAYRNEGSRQPESSGQLPKSSKNTCSSGTPAALSILRQASSIRGGPHRYQSQAAAF